jgi:Trk K+ transport system NAD-binding subunit
MAIIFLRINYIFLTACFHRLDEVLTADATRIEDGDRLVVAGADQTVREFEPELA